MMLAETGEAFGAAGRWALVPIALMTAAILMLVHSQMGTGRRWLLILALGSRLVAILVNMACPHGLCVPSMGTVLMGLKSPVDKPDMTKTYS